LRREVGRLSVTSTAGGALVVDGRARGQLPLRTPLRVRSGSHLVRVIKDGYATFEARVDVAADKLAEVDAKLRPLAGLGQLRVEDVSGEGSAVYVDDVRVGAAPWEGTLAAGPHLLWTAGGARGSAPARVVVLEGQAALVRVASSRLGPPVTLAASPAG